MSPQHGFTQVNGLRLHHLDYGGSGPVTLLIHGVMGHAWMWAGVAPTLAEHFKVISLDLRGYGDSQWSTDGQYPTSKFAEDTVGLAEKHGWASIRIVGFSLGGLVGLAVADKAPDLVDRLVMIDLPPSSEKAPADLPPVAMRVDTHSGAVQAESRFSADGQPEMMEVMALFGWRPDSRGSLVRKHDPAMAREWPFRSEDWWGALERFDGPLLFVHGRASQVCSGELAAVVASRARFGTLVEIEGAGHLIPIEQPAVLAHHLTEFLR